MRSLYEYRNGIPVMRDASTGESTPLGAPFHDHDDFGGACGLAAIPAASSEEAGVKWVAIDVGAATQAYVADASAIAIALTNASEAQDAAVDYGDQLSWDVTNGGEMEFRAKLTVLPTTGVVCVAGIAGPHNLDKDTVANHAWFRWQASAVLLTESDDTTNDNDDTATGLTTVVSVYHIYRIDFSNLASVKFYVDNARVSSATTFDMSNLTAAEKIMQPYFSLDKASGTGVGTLQIDYMQFWGPRGA